MDPQTPTTQTPSITRNLSMEAFSSIIEMAGYGVGYWASSMRSVKSDVPHADLGEGWFYLASCYITEDESGDEFHVTLDMMAKAAVTLASNGKLNNYYTSAIQDLVCTGETCMVGSDIADALMQQACFGEVVYG